MADVRDRIVGLRRVPAAELRANPRNWRRHPPGQQRALQALLERVGYAGALIARETPDGLELIDGHLRADLAGSEQVPVLVVDVDEDEARLLLSTLDPLGDMAEVDTDGLASLLQEVQLDSADLERFLGELVPGVLPEPGTRETAFLDAIAGDATAHNWAAPSPGSPYFTVTVSVTAEERAVIRQALTLAMKNTDATTTPAAMVQICRRYLEAMDADRDVG